MTTATPAAQTTQGAAAAPAPPKGAELSVPVVQPAASHTPRSLRRYQLVAAVAVLILGLLAVAQLTQLRTALSAAPALGIQHVRLGEVSAAVSAAGNRAAADALAGSGTLQSAGSIATAAGLLVSVAAAEPSQAEAISAINADLVGYGQLLATGDFDKAELLADGSIQPALDKLSQQLSAQAVPDSWWTSPLAAIGLGVLVLAALVWISYQVAQRSHRVLNLGLAVAIVAVVAISGLAAGGTPVSAGAQQGGRSVVDASAQLTSAQLQADAATRTLLDAARLKKWDKTAQEAFAKTDQQAADGFTEELATRYAALQGARKPVTAALAAGDWATAANLLTRDDSLAGASTSLTDDITEQRAALGASTTTDSAADALLLLFEAGCAILALTGALLAVRGLQTRIEEYR